MRPVLLPFALLLAACENDTAKAKRLYSAQVSACVDAEMKSGSPNWTGAAKVEAKAKCDVATRDYNKFMSGR